MVLSYVASKFDRSVGTLWSLVTGTSDGMCVTFIFSYKVEFCIVGTR
jgi:hypothetical protein